MSVSLDSLPTEVLIKIFKYLDVEDLCKLKQTCKRFNEIIEKWGHLLTSEIKPLVTNQTHPVIINRYEPNFLILALTNRVIFRSARKLSHLERLRITKNWQLGVYDEMLLLYSKIKYFPYLQMERDLLWVSREGYIHGYKRNKNGINPRRPVYSLKAKNNADVFRFVKRKNFILSGQT